MNFNKKILALLIPVLIVITLEGYLYFDILAKNNGHFVYTLDDAYIHLSLAENILQGNYGINPNETVAPSSSIIFPYILSGLLWLFNTDSAAFIFNSLISIFSVIIIWKITKLLLPKISLTKTVVLNVIFIFTGNLVNHVFNGMEHSLQMLFTLTFLYGVIKEHYEKKLNISLMIGIIFTPLIRYEALAFSFTAIAYYCIKERAYIKQMLIATILLLIPVLYFSYFLLSNKLGILPSSIMIKTGAASKSYGFLSIFNELRNNLTDPACIILIVIVILYVVYLAKFRTLNNLLLVGFITLPIIAHLLFGKFGWFFRYDIYITLAAFVYTLFFIIHHFNTHKNVVIFNRVLIIFTAILTLVSLSNLKSTFLVTGGSNNIYEQQYQMHRFVTDYYKKNVAVNDVGYVSYKNENYVLDFVGLASKEVVDYRKAGKNILIDLPKKHDIKLFIIYDSWYKNKPTDWILLGNMYLGERNITPAENKVTFYTNDRDSIEFIKDKLKQWSKELPGKSKFIFGAS